MMISYVPGSVVLQRLWKKGQLGQARLLLLFLGTEYDRSFLEDVIRYGHDLDALLHDKFCIGLLFMPPPGSEAGERSAIANFKYFHNLPWRDDPELTERVVKRMTSESYDLARSLEIPFENLPGIAFLSASEPGAVAYLSLAHSSLPEVFRDLRRVMSDWYQDNRRALEAHRADRELAFREQTANFIDQVRQGLAATGQGAHLTKKLPKALVHAPVDPSEIRNLMIRHNFAVEIDGKEMKGGDVERQLIELRSTPPAGLPDLPNFDLDRIRRVNRKIQLKHATSVSMNKGKGVMEWIKLLREAFAPL